jgi:hypothetical protein
VSLSKQIVVYLEPDGRSGTLVLIRVATPHIGPSSLGGGRRGTKRPASMIEGRLHVFKFLYPIWQYPTKT